MTPGIDRRQFLAGAAVAAGATAVTSAEASAAAAAGTLQVPQAAALPPGVTLPARGIYHSAPAATWNDGLLTSNGEIGAAFYGSPSGERVIFNRHRFVLPNGTRDINSR